MADAKSRIVIEGAQAVQTVQQVSAALEKLSQTMGKVKQAERGLSGGKGEQALNKTKTATDKAREASEKLNRQTLQTLEAFVRYNIVNQIFNRITRGIRDATKAASDLQFAIAEVNTLTQKSTAPEIQQGVLKISTDFGIPAAETAKAVYQALSNRVGDLSDSLSFVADNAKLAKAGFADLAETGNLVSSVMNAYGLAFTNANQIQDTLFKTVEQGRTTLTELSSSLGVLLQPAAALGINFGELAATLDTITLAGVKTDRAVTGLRNVLFTTLKPSKELDAALEQAGFTSVQAGIAANGFIGFLQKLIATTGGTSQELAKLFPNMRAFQGAIGATANEGETLNSVFAAFNDEAQGVVDNALAIVEATNADQLRKNANEFHNILTTEIGDSLIEIGNLAINTFGGAATSAKGLAEALKTLAPAAGVAIFGGVIATLTRLGKALVGTGAASVVAAAAIGTFVGTVVGRFAFARAPITAFTDELERVKAKFAEFSKQDIEKLELKVEVDAKQFESDAAGVVSALEGINNAYKRNSASIIAGQDQVSASLRDQIDERVSILEDFFKKVKSASDTATKNIDKIVSGVRDAKKQIDNNRFELRIKGLEGSKLASEIVKQSKSLQAAARKELSQGNNEEAVKLQNEALQLAIRASNVTGQQKIGLQQVAAVYKQIEATAASRTAFEKETEALARQNRTTLGQQVLEAKKLAKEIQTLQKQKLDDPFGDNSDLDAQISKATDDFNKVFDNINFDLLDRIAPGAKEKLQQLFLDPTNGQEVELDVALKTSANQFRDELQAALDKVDPLQIVAKANLIFGTTTGVGNINEAVNKAAALKQEGATTIRNSPAVEKAKKDRDDILLALRQTFINNANELKEGGITTADTLKVVGKNLVGAFVSSLTFQVNQQLPTIDDVVSNKVDQIRGLFDISRQITEAAGFADPEALSNLAIGIQELVDAGKVDPKIGQQSLAEIAKFKTANDKYQQVLQQQDQAVEKSVRPINDMVSVLDQQKAAQQRTKDATEVAIAAEEALRAAREDAGGSAAAARIGAAGKANGGAIFRAGGGFARGTDIIPAMLSPGEFVMNARSARQFHSQLVAMNSGMQPIYRAQGGDVTNITNNQIGDIQINGTARSNGREIAETLQRTLRRKAASL